jgi:crossover junction endodeoxyribonuclease RusA
MIEFFVPGLAQPGGSKRAFPIRRKDGSVGVAVSDANPKVYAWREVVALAASRACTSPLTGPVELHVEFVMQRPQGHYGAKGLKRSSPHWHLKKPDATKLTRALEDALTGIAWQDDAQVVLKVVKKRYVRENEPPGAHVLITTLDDETGP